MSTDGHLNALRAYEAAVSNLYEAPLEQRLASADEAAPTPAADEQRVGAVLEASRALTETTTAMLEDDNPDVRASAQARLAALAVKDIAIAFDVAQLEVDERPQIASAELPGATLQVAERDVAFVLEGDPADGVPALPGEHLGRAQLASADVDAYTALRAALPAALVQVRDDATDVVVGGLGTLAGTELGNALGGLATGLLQQLPAKVKRWYRWALDLLKQGIQKLRNLLGETFDKAVKAVEDWLKESGPQALADWVYGVPALSSDLTALVDKAAGDDSAGKDWEQIEEDVQAVVRKFASVKKVVLAVFKVIGLARSWILRALGGPAGEAAVDATFVLGTIFGLFAGGDYIDWRRTKDEGAFDFVRGVRRTAEGELAS